MKSVRAASAQKGSDEPPSDGISAAAAAVNSLWLVLPVAVDRDENVVAKANRVVERRLQCRAVAAVRVVADDEQVVSFGEEIGRAVARAVVYHQDIGGMAHDFIENRGDMGPLIVNRQRGEKTYRESHDGGELGRKSARRRGKRGHADRRHRGPNDRVAMRSAEHRSSRFAVRRGARALAGGIPAARNVAAMLPSPEHSRKGDGAVNWRPTENSIGASVGRLRPDRQV